MNELDIRGKLARIDRALADHDRKRQGVWLAPWLPALFGMSTGAALFAAGAACVKLVGG